MVATSTPEDREAMLEPIADGTWRVDVHSLGTRRPRSLGGKVALIERLEGLLNALPGAVDLKSPDSHVVAMIEDWRAMSRGAVKDDGGGSSSQEARGREREGGAKMGATSVPGTLFLARQLSEGAASHLASLALSDRSYLGRTTLPPDLAYLMAMQARVAPGDIVLDPFCGTASVLMACATLGATKTVGVDVDASVILGEHEGRNGIERNFEEAGLCPPPDLIVGDMADIDTLLPLTPGTPGSQCATFDAIVTDPPYGLMEGLGPFYQPLRERLTQLLALACRRLRVGGRLVFLLPLPPSVRAADAFPSQGLPTSRWLQVETVSRQHLSQRMHRLMVTVVKVAEPPADELRDALADSSHAEWSKWWTVVDSIERMIAPEARRVW